MPNYETRFVLNGQTHQQTYSTPQATSGQAIVGSMYPGARVVYWREVRSAPSVPIAQPGPGSPIAPWYGAPAQQRPQQQQRSSGGPSSGSQDFPFGMWILLGFARFYWNAFSQLGVRLETFKCNYCGAVFRPDSWGRQGHRCHCCKKYNLDSAPM